MRFWVGKKTRLDIPFTRIASSEAILCRIIGLKEFAAKEKLEIVVSAADLKR